MKKGMIRILIAVYDKKKNENILCTGEGLTLIEAVLRATNTNYTDEELQNILFIYGDDLEGLCSWYEEQGYILSEPNVLPSVDRLTRKSV